MSSMVTLVEDSYSTLPPQEQAPSRAASCSPQPSASRRVSARAVCAAAPEPPAQPTLARPNPCHPIWPAAGVFGIIPSMLNPLVYVGIYTASVDQDALAGQLTALAPYPVVQRTVCECPAAALLCSAAAAAARCCCCPGIAPALQLHL